MTGSYLPLFLATALIALSSPGASAQSVLRRCEKPMADAEAAVREVGECAASLTASSPKAGKSGRQPLLEAPAEIVAAATAEPMTLELIGYASFRAYAMGDAGACAPQPFSQWDMACRNAFLDLRAARAAVGPASEFSAACSQTDQPKSGEEARQWSQCCGLFAQNIGRPDACGSALRQCASNQQDCRSFLSSLGGDAAGCDLIVPGNPDSCTSAADCRQQKLACQGRAAFVKAYKARNAALCGSSDYCRVLMGEGKKVVQDLGARLSKSPAGRWYVERDWDKSAAPAAPAAGAKFATTIRGFSCEAPLGSAANRQAASAVLSAAQLCYSDVELALTRTDAAVLQAIDAAEEKIIRLGLRLNATFDGATASARAPAEKPGK